MIEDKTPLPEGTDRIVTGAGVDTTDERNAALQEAIAEDSGETADQASASGSRGAIKEQVRTTGDKIAGQAAEKARGLVAQGIERSSEALGNVSRLVGDTAGGLDERLGSEYGDYARSAAQAIDRAATSLASKDADELIEDARGFVRKSPGVALAGAAVIGFALVRLVKSGLSDDRDSGGKGGSKA